MIVQAAGASEQAVGPAAVEQAPADAPVPPATSAGPILCQVPGCNTNLVGLAQFYRRVRICETHGKAHSITDASGHAMRFCQQCSKLQPLELFSGDRRSCATSLDKRRARRSVAAAGVRASGEASPGRESVERKRRSNQGSPDAEESPGQLGLSKRHSPLRDSGSLTWSMDSFGEERAHSQPQLAPSSGRGGSSLGSPGLSMHGWPVSSEEGAPSGGAPAAATPVWQLLSCGSPMPSFVLGGEASVQAPPPLPALLQHSVRPALQAAQPAVATSRLLPHPHTPAAGAASGRPVSEVPALMAMPLPLAEQLALQMHLSTPAAQPALPAAQLAVPAANATDAELLDWLATEDAHLLSEFAALPPVPQPQQRSATGMPGPPMLSAELEAAAAEAAASLGVDLNDTSLLDLAVLGLSPTLPCSPAAAVCGGSPAGGSPASCGAAAVSPAAALPPLHPAGSQELPQHLQHAQQWQHHQLHDLQQQVQHLQHAGQFAAASAAAARAASLPLPLPAAALSLPHAPSAAASQAASLPLPLPAAAPDGSAVAAPTQGWPLPPLGSDISSGTGCTWIKVERVDQHQL